MKPQIRRSFFVINLLLLAAIFFIVPNISFATSGACSYHSGVNCGAGATIEGKVRCNDGWINSSVYFVDAEECKITKSSCDYPTHAGCDVEYAKQTAIGRAESRSYAVGRAGGNGALLDWTQDPSYVTCKLTQALYQSELDWFNKCIANELKPLVDTQQYTVDVCIAMYGTRARLDSKNMCVCMVGNMLDGKNQCMPAGDVCVGKHGQYGQPFSDTTCGCAYGYHMDSKQWCVEDAKPVRLIPFAVKKWVDDNYAYNTSCSTNTVFTPQELITCNEYQNIFTNRRYDWQVEASAPIKTTPAAVSATPVPPTIPPAKPKVEIPKSKVFSVEKPIEKITATTSKKIEFMTPPVQAAPFPEVAKIPPPQAPKPKSLWTRAVDWLKFW